MRSSVVTSVISESFGSIEKLPLFEKNSSTICCISVIIGCMSEKEMEKNLEYGDCFNFLGILSSLLVETVGTVKEKIEKNIDKVLKN